MTAGELRNRLQDVPDSCEVEITSDRNFCVLDNASPIIAITEIITGTEPRCSRLVLIV